MEFNSLGLLVLLHVLFGALWFGAVVYQVFVIGPALRAAGPQGGGFVATLMRMGRVGKFFGLAGGLAVLFGIIVYIREDISDLGMEGRALWINIGMVSAIVALVIGATINMPTERKMQRLVANMKGPPTAEQGREMGELGAKMGKAGMMAFVFVSLAIVMMLMQRVFI